MFLPILPRQAQKIHSPIIKGVSTLAKSFTITGYLSWCSSGAFVVVALATEVGVHPVDCVISVESAAFLLWFLLVVTTVFPDTPTLANTMKMVTPAARHLLGFVDAITDRVGPQRFLHGPEGFCKYRLRISLTIL